MKKGIMVKLISAIMHVCMLAGAMDIGSADVMAANTTYYVSSISGNDLNNGTSPSTAWKSLSKVNSITFQPGDQILFNAGSSWSGQLKPLGSGSSGNPIKIDMYGTGSKPIINGGGTDTASVLLSNQQYWEISNLEITNITSDVTQSRQGIYITASDFGTCNHIYIQNCNIHDVNGKDDVFGRSGGIIFNVGGSTTPTNFNDVLINGNTISMVDYNGITVAPSVWKNRDGYKTGVGSWTPHTNVVIQDNVVNSSKRAGIFVRECNAPLIDHNTIIDAGKRADSGTNTVGTWVWNSDDAITQYNYISGTTGSHPDGEAIDMDWMNKREIVQYNYTYHNEGGGLLICCNGGNGTDKYSRDGVIRYNIFDREKRGTFRLCGSGSINNTFYNNTVYIASGSSANVISNENWSGYPKGTKYYNNIFCNLGTGNYVMANSTDNVFDYNCFYGKGSESNSDAHKITSNPQLVKPESGGIDGFKLQAISPCINSGTLMASNGGKDYFGNSLNDGAPDIGANEYSGDSPTPIPPTLTSDFEDGNSTDWTVVNGTWSVVTDGTNVYKQSSTALAESLIYAGDNAWTDYTMQAKIKLYGTVSEAASGIVGRYTDNSNYYMLRLHTGTQKVQLYKKVDGIITLLNETAMTLNTNTTYTVKLIMNGSSLTGYVDGVQKVFATDTSLTSGCIGARGYGQSFSIDDVTIN